MLLSFFALQGCNKQADNAGMARTPEDSAQTAVPAGHEVWKAVPGRSVGFRMRLNPKGEEPDFTAFSDVKNVERKLADFSRECAAAPGEVRVKIYLEEESSLDLLVNVTVERLAGKGSSARGHLNGATHENIFGMVKSIDKEFIGQLTGQSERFRRRGHFICASPDGGSFTAFRI